MVRRLEGLLDELTQAAADADPAAQESVSDPEKEADRWVRRYVRSQSVPLPAEQIVSILLARATYAATFARVTPRQDVELSIAKAAEIVEILLIDLWHGCFRKNWLQTQQSTRQPTKPRRATLVPMNSRYFRQPLQDQPGLWN